MKQSRISVAVVFSLFAIQSIVVAQTSAARKTSTKAVARPVLLKAKPFSMPSRLIECESAFPVCTTAGANYVFPWVFTGTKGKLIIPQSNVDIDLTIEQFEPDSIVVTRVDRNGPMAGITGKYTGKFKDGRITGTVSWVWPGHQLPQTANWGALFEDEQAILPEAYTDGKRPSTIPKFIYECDPEGSCGQWTLSSSTKTGSAMWNTTPAVTATLKIESFEPDNIFIRRAFPDNSAASAVYKGTLKGARIVGNVSFFNGDKEVGGGKWQALILRTSCQRSDGLEPSLQQADTIGWDAAKFHQFKDAFDCWTVGARTGDPRAQTGLASLYMNLSPPVPQNYSEGLALLHKADAQNYPDAAKRLAAAYLLGLGVTRDSILSDYWLIKESAAMQALKVGAVDTMSFNLLYGVGPPPVKIANGHHIVIPRDANEQFASYPADIRAVLRPGRHVPDKVDQPCNTGDEVGSESALEIGKAAYRSGDFERGHCWMLRSAKAGNPHASVLLGVSALMGWGTPKSEQEAFRYFKSIDPRDNLWDQYFLQYCYLNGIGTAVDIDMANKIVSTAIRQQAIGKDDIEEARKAERIHVEMFPPHGLSLGGNCYKIDPNLPLMGRNEHNCQGGATDIDQPQLARLLDEADHFVPSSIDLIDPTSPR
jgi:uncharacterized protein